MHPIIIIGSGLAAYTLAREFRKLDQDTPLTIITASDGNNYSKPMLSNALAKNKTAEGLVIAAAETVSEQLNAAILTKIQVSKIDRQAHSVMADGQQLQYSKLVLAVGADPIVPPFAGNGAEGILQVNDLQDYSNFRDQLADARFVTIIGAGLIGCEFANDLVNVGFDITVVGMGDTPLDTLIPEPAGIAMKTALEEKGIHWRLGTTVAGVEKLNDRYQVIADSGEPITADVVLSAVGLRSSTTLAANSGLETNRGIVTDEFLQTSDDDIYALGDCAEIESQVLPYVMPIMTGARALAKTLAGDATAVVYPVMPVIIKTPDYPVVIVPGAAGDWSCETTASGVRCLRKDGAQLTGFCLTGDFCKEKQALVKELNSQ